MYCPWHRPCQLARKTKGRHTDNMGLQEDHRWIVCIGLKAANRGGLKGPWPKFNDDPLTKTEKRTSDKRVFVKLRS